MFRHIVFSNYVFSFSLSCLFLCLCPQVSRMSMHDTVLGLEPRTNCGPTLPYSFMSLQLVQFNTIFIGSCIYFTLSTKLKASDQLTLHMMPKMDLKIYLLPKTSLFQIVSGRLDGATFTADIKIGRSLAINIDKKEVRYLKTNTNLCEEDER
jgi:hypothetical protein